MRGPEDRKPQEASKFEGKVQQEGKRRRIEAFVLERMHAEVMTDRQERFHESHDKQDKQV